MRSAYKHYRNTTEPGVRIFATTTILDFVLVFAEPFNADLMAGSLRDDLRHHRAELNAFVVMGHHIHLLACLPEGMIASKLLERLKSNSGKRIVPHLSETVRKDLSVQKGLN